MDSHSENTRRIAKNTLMLYVRMLFGMLVSLYTSRVVLQALGVEDYGIYNVVGGFVAMFSMISASLSSSVGRFLTFELGKGDVDALKRVFSTSLSIHVVLSVIIVLLAETIGIWFLNTHMTIPEARLYAANWVFQASVFTFVINLWSVPFSASIVAHERMSAFAYIGILDIVLRLVIVLFIAYSGIDFDRLIVYALLLVAVVCLMQMIYWRYCYRNFEECRISLYFDTRYLKAMSSFAGWSFIGCMAGLLKDQGVNILLNIFGGTILNAARGISNSVNVAVASFAGNFMSALNPQITKSYASKDYNYMLNLIEQGSRFSFYIMLIFVLPIFFETEFILTLWLKQYPEYTATFVRLTLLLSLCDIISNPLITLQSATGKIRSYQIVVGSILLMNFPLSYYCLSMNFSPESTLFVAIFISIVCLVARLIFLKKTIVFSITNFVKHVCFNILKVFISSMAIPLLLYIFLSDGLIKHIIVIWGTLICTLISIIFIGCSVKEREFLLQQIKKNAKKIFSL